MWNSGEHTADCAVYVHLHVWVASDLSLSLSLRVYLRVAARTYIGRGRSVGARPTGARRHLAKTVLRVAETASPPGSLSPDADELVVIAAACYS